MKNTKTKGHIVEDWIADQIVAKGIDLKARRDGGSGAGNREKADISTSMMILGQGVGIEAKNHKVVKMQEWWKQAEKLEVLGLIPILAFKLHRDSIENTLVTLKLDTFLDLVVEANGEKQVIEKTVDSRSLQYKMERARQAVKELVKELDN